MTTARVTSAALTATERCTLAAVCDALLPALVPGLGDDPGLFARSAADLGVPERIEEALATLPAGQQRQLRFLLRLLERRWLMLLLARRPRGFSALGAERQERALLRMARSRSARLRTGFQALKRLAGYLFYAVPDASGENPSWPAIGFRPAPVPEAAAPRLRLTPVRGPTRLEADVCVIGSGAGGGVVAAELAAAGRRVVVLEAGSGLQAPDFEPRELPGMQRLYLDGGLTATSDLGLAILAGATLGGGTAVNWQTSLRLPDEVRDEWAEASGCRHFVETGFTRAFEAVEARLGIGTGESVHNPANEALRRGCDMLGLRWKPIPRNARGCELEQCGHCMFGCRPGGKQSTAVTYLADAQRDGDTRIVASCRAERVLWKQGRVTGVEAVATDATTAEPHLVRVVAPLVVVAAGGIGSPALLLRSGLRLPALGRNLFLHPTGAVGGHYREPIELWRGAPQTVVCDEFARLAGGYGFRLETVPAHPGLMAMSIPWLGARDHRRRMQDYAHVGAFIVLTRDRSGGTVRLARDGSVRVDYRPGRREREQLRHGIATAARVHVAAGAHEVHTLHAVEHCLRVREGDAAAVDAFCERVARSALDRNRSLLFSAHQMGTCRMGRDPRTAVCDADGEVFGVRGLFVADASAFPLSSGVNPMLTVMALALHTAKRILER